MHQNSDMDFFLATTALEEFWDFTKPIVFLGPWCRPHGAKAHPQLRGGDVLQTPFDSSDAVAAAYGYVNEAYERILPSLASALNSLHGKQHSVRYWRIVAGPWLHVYLSAVYDRYSHLKRAISEYPAFSTVGLDAAAHVVAVDTHHFSSYLVDDTFNLQIYTKILSALGFKFPRSGGGSAPPAGARPGRRTWKQKAIRTVTATYARSAARVFKSVVFKDSYFPKAVELELALKNAGKILPVWGPAAALPEWSRRTDLRDQLRDITLGASEFEQCVSAMLFSDLPMCFIEGYESVCAASRADYPRATKAVFSANAWYYDEVFKQWAASESENGTRLLGTQHGGNYGALAMMPSEDHETAIVDQYYSWGWERQHTAAEVISMPASKLVGRERVAPRPGKNGVLWVATSSPRYLVQFPWVPAQFEEYLRWQNRFAGALADEVAGQVRLRPHREDHGWGLVHRFRAAFPQIPVEGWEISFQDSLSNCRLYICDHLSTTFIEALSANTPTILFWDAAANQLRPEAQEYYDLLARQGILFSDPESAARAVNCIFNDVESWWNDPERQCAVTRFCARFARTSPDARALWNSELRRIAAPVAR